MPLTWKLNAALVLALACLGVALGAWLKRRVRLLERLNMPVPIVGGAVYAIGALALRGHLNFDIDTSLRDLLMIAFMTTVGLNARLKLLRQGSGLILRLLAIASITAVLQNVLGIGLASLLGIDRRIGILAGSVALAGGPATAASFGPTFERLGVSGGLTIALASATFGIAVAGLIGSWIGASLAGRKRLHSGGGPQFVKLEHAQTGDLLPTVLAIGVAMGLGNLLSAAIERAGFILPAYIGAMIVAAIIRNLDDRFAFAHIGQGEIDSLARIALYLFIVMALLSLRLWELAHLALPILIILGAQVIFCWLVCITLCYRGMGGNYEAAVMSAGFCGFMLGITANAVACIEELVEEYGPAPQAFLAVPIVGAFLIDLTNSMAITAFANWFR